MKAIDIIDALPYRGPLTTAYFLRRNKKAIERARFVPVRAIYDENRDCIYCGEAGRCPGWHTQEETR